MRHIDSNRCEKAWRRVLRPRWAILGILLSCVTGAFADDVTMQLTGATWGSHLGGVYTDPYYATIGPANQSGPTVSGVTMAVLCDDFTTNVNIGDIWQATSTSVAMLSNNNPSTWLPLKFDQGDGVTQYNDYMAAAYLATEIMSTDQSTPTGAHDAELMSFALWGIFDPNGTPSDPCAPLNSCSLSPSDLSTAEADLQAARTAVAGMTAADFANVYVYTPNPLGASQEYFVVTPEPATFGFMAVALMGMFYGMHRFRKAGSHSA